MLSQRPQEVNKKVLNLAELLFVFQLTGTHERKAVEAWIGDKGIEAEDIQAELPKLERGHPHAWSPAWLKVSRVIEIGTKTTFDASSTPKVGAQIVVRELSPIDLEQLRVDMAASVEKAKADDPKELRAQIATLKTQLAKAQKSGTVVEKPVTVIDQKAIERAVDGTVRPLVAEMNSRLSFLRRAVSVVARDGKALVSSLAGLEAVDLSAIEPKANGNGHANEKRETPVSGDLSGAKGSTVGRIGRHLQQGFQGPGAARSTENIRARSASRQHDGTTTGVEQRVLNTLAGLEALGVAEPDKVTVGALCGYSNIRSKSFQNAIGALRTSGRVEYPSEGRIALTDDGRAIAENSLDVSSLDELHRLWYKLLGGVSEKILAQLVESYPDALPLDDVASNAGYENARSKSFANAKGRLRTLGLIAYPRDGMIAATDLLFPEALR
jgi:uncharacterized protein